MGRVFEACDIQDESHILSSMVATDWGEMPSSSLFESLPVVGGDEMAVLGGDASEEMPS